MTELARFDDVAQVLAAAGSTVHGSEAHGCLCGAACARRDYGLAEWMEEIFPDGATVEDDLLATLRARTAAALAAGQMEFEPLLPDDEQPLAVRVGALSAWCHGFLYGFGAAGTTGGGVELPADVAEVLADLARFSHAGAVGSESPEVEESAYVELVEFVRAAVQLVYDELAALRASQPPPSTGH
jgi:uncharacterized protein YgfB (UPF0149 family)